MVKPAKGKRSVHIPHKQVISLADTHMKVNGCQVLLGHPDPTQAKQAAYVFKMQLNDTVRRAKIPNMSDLYNAHSQMLSRIKKGETIEEIMQ